MEDGFAVLSYTHRRKIEQLARQSGGRLRIVDDRSVYLPLDKAFEAPDELVSMLKMLLWPA